MKEISLHQRPVVNLYIVAVLLLSNLCGCNCNSSDDSTIKKCENDMDCPSLMVCGPGKYCISRQNLYDGGEEKDADNTDIDAGNGEVISDISETKDILKDTDSQTDINDISESVDDTGLSDGGIIPTNNSPLGTNLDGLNDWSSVYPFVNVFRMARAWISGSSSQWDDGRPLSLDDNGWVTSLLPGQIARTLVFTDIEGHYPGGKYVVLYDGEGTIEYYGSATKDEGSSEPGRDVIDVEPRRGTLFLNITATKPGNYIRNIRIIMPGFEQTYNSQVFHPDFLKAISVYKVIRFMDWMATNNSDQVEWADRPKPTDAVYTIRGAPVEVMVDLVNRLGIDPWFCMPHKANDEYVTQFATYVRDHLAPGLKVYVEYSNEVWNNMFAQAGYARDRGLALGLSSNDFEAQLRYYSRRAVEIFNIWTKVFGGTDRLVRVMASQAANVWTATTELDFENAFTRTDALAIAPYFGGGYGEPANSLSTLALGISGLIADISKSELPQIRAWIAANADAAQERGVDLIAYEGGQHLVGIHGEENNENLNNLFDAVNLNPEMKTIYLEYLAIWKEEGGGLFCHFVDTGRWSKWGRWGARRYMDETRKEMPKYDALMTFIEQTQRWW
ncbi:MAG: cellulose-binding protein [Deltaproteobacteria bacterium]|nr:cellulose-binding protein [Deltaproteobacteria bacterium]